MKKTIIIFILFLLPQSKSTYSEAHIFTHFNDFLHISTHFSPKINVKFLHWGKKIYICLPRVNLPPQNKFALQCKFTSPE